MKYTTTDELEHFDFKESYIFEIQSFGESFSIILDSVTILPENSCNRDIRKMRANQLMLRIRDAHIQAFVEEGYKIYSADGKLMRNEEDRPIATDAYATSFKELSGCMIDSIEKKDGAYEFSIYAEDHTFLIRVSGSGDLEEWDRFLNLDSE